MSKLVLVFILFRHRSNNCEIQQRSHICRRCAPMGSFATLNLGTAAENALETEDEYHFFLSINSMHYMIAQVNGFPQDLFTIENMFLPNQEGNELKWFQLSQERSGIFSPYTSASNDSAHQTFPHQVQGQGCLRRARNNTITHYCRSLWVHKTTPREHLYRRSAEPLNQLRKERRIPRKGRFNKRIHSQEKKKRKSFMITATTEVLSATLSA